MQPCLYSQHLRWRQEDPKFEGTSVHEGCAWCLVLVQVADHLIADSQDTTCHTCHSHPTPDEEGCRGQKGETPAPLSVCEGVRDEKGGCFSFGG